MNAKIGSMRYYVPVPLIGTGERLHWVRERFGEWGDRWNLGEGAYYFKYEEDAVLFTLRWK